MLRVTIGNLRAQQAAQCVSEPGPRDSLLFSADLQRIVKRGLLVMTLVAAILFLLLPRSNASGFTDVWNTDTIQSGFSDVVSFRDVEEITPSDQVVMQVKLDSRHRRAKYRFRALSTLLPGAGDPGSSSRAER